MNNKKIIKLTQDLIKFPSTENNIKARKDIVLFVYEQFKNYPVFIKKFNYNNNPSIVITLKEERSPVIFLNGHLDVVPASFKKNFKPYIKDNRIYGRGSGDMKAACAVMIEIMKYFAQQKNKLSIGLMLTTDEECGGENGVGYLINKQKYTSKLALIPDGGKNLNSIILNEKGMLRFKLKAYGKSAHSARPFWGENAIDKLLKIYSEIRKIVPEIKEKEWRNSLNLSIISGGDIINKVPDYAEALIDIRFLTINDKKNILNKIYKITKDIEIILEASPFVHDKNNFYIKKYQDILKQELNKEVEFLNSEASSDARFFSENNISTIITKINCQNIHSKNEWVDIKEAESFYRILVKFIPELFRDRA